MKTRYKILLLLILLVGGVILAGAQFEPVKAAARKIVYNLRFEDGLVGYWSFDGKDMSGVTAYDRSGNGNNGTLTGGPTAIPGAVGQALKFDGSNDYVSVAHNEILNPGSDSFSAAAWIKPNGNQASQTGIFQKTGGDYYIFEIETANKMYYEIRDNATGAENRFTGSGTNSLNSGAWNQVVWVIDRTAQNIYLYLNGQLDKTISISTMDEDISPSSILQIGAHVGYFNGVIDEPRLYNRALSAAEIAYQYARTKPGGSGTSGTVAKSVANNNGLVGYWDFDDCDTCTTVADRSGNGNTGTMYNAAGPTAGDLHTASGKVGRGATFDGTDDYVSAPDSASFAFAGNVVTLAAWIKVDPSSSGNRAVVSQYNGGVAGGILWYLVSDNTLTYHDGGSGNVASNATFTDGKWHYVTYVSQSSTSHQIYVDGVLDKNDSSSAVVMNSAQPMQIGAGLSSSVPAYKFKGQIDEVKIYNRALSADEVKNLYNSTRKMFVNVPQKDLLTDGLVGFWSFNGPDVSGTTAYDRSGSGNNGTLANGPTATPGISGQALNFDGVNDSVGMTAGTLAIPYSISFWYKIPNVSTAFMVPLALNSAAFPYVRYAYTPSRMLFYAGSEKYRYSNGIDHHLDEWHYFTGIVAGTDVADISIYIDGLPSNGSAGADTGVMSSPGTTWTVGRLSNGSLPFYGSIDEVRIYNRALSAAEVLKLYNATKH